MKSKSNIHYKPMYDLYAKGNYRGSFKTKKDVENYLKTLMTIENLEQENPLKKNELKEAMNSKVFTILKSEHIFFES